MNDAPTRAPGLLGTGPAAGGAQAAWLEEAHLDALETQWRAVKRFEALDGSGGLDARYTRAWLDILRTYPELLEAARAGLPVQREAAARASQGRRAYDASRAGANQDVPQRADQEVSPCADQEVPQRANQGVSQRANQGVSQRANQGVSRCADQEVPQ